MADNTQLPIGTQDGDIYASDDISTVKFQRVKVTLGADGVNDGDVASGNPLPVDISGVVIATDTPDDSDGGLVVRPLLSCETEPGNPIPGNLLAIAGLTDELSPKIRPLTLTETAPPSGSGHSLWVAIDGAQGDVLAQVVNTVETKEKRSATGTTSQVADTASNATLLASNSSRLGASIENDSSAVLYVKLGTTATTSDYTVRMVQYAYYEVPSNYTGRIDGIWASDPGDGAARVTEFT